MRGRGQFDLQAGDGQHPVQDVHQRVGQRAAQVAQFGGEAGEADPRLGGERAARRPPCRSASQEGVEGVGERDHLGRVDAFDGLGEPAVRVVVVAGAAPCGRAARARRPSSARSRGPMRQRGPVSSRTREALAVGVLEDLADGDEVGDLGQVQQPGEADDLDRDVPGDQGAPGSRRSRPAVRHRTAISPGGVPVRTRWARESASQSISSAWVGSRAQRTDAVALGAGGGAQRLDALVQGAQRGGEAVGEVEQAAAAAAVLAEGVAARRGVPSACGKCAREVVEVGDGGAAPAVDGLAGVADGGDGVRRCRPPNRPASSSALGDGGVLVLVEQDDRGTRRAGCAPTSGGCGRASADRAIWSPKSSRSRLRLASR